MNGTEHRTRVDPCSCEHGADCRGFFVRCSCGLEAEYASRAIALDRAALHERGT